ncbi:MAG TPA: flagellar hook-associated protein FlgL [Nitrosomonas sp.]|nr:flagellar hook-associated protein FlgL [Nitrosomonas sp.]HQX13088.1 flagellar hook-associated protein FlgL [Nitrosomonas sp.]HRB32722.1 flagellar hook-associated protein FlgL [Nitrosomonas sp.]HRB45121.1 flagellar hook-associated protein FlgL [Nitrosomonas sp.]HRB77338.1 flagellar hook-associated protein FlgL [Nitrosomonas sp.]
MRISSNTIFETGTNLMLQQQDTLIKTQQQLSTGRRVLTPADDPIAAAQALNVSQSLSLNQQYSVNRTTADSSLKLEENVLKKVTALLQDVHESAIRAGTASFTDADRVIVAKEIRSQLESLVGLTNTTDEKGQYLFSGYQATTKPFTQSGLNVQYQGDQGQRLSQVGPSRQLAISDPGTDIFERIKDGNSVFTTAANSLNLGTGVIDVGSVVNPANLTGNNYEINFTVTAGVTTYDIVNTTTATPVSSGNSYTNSSSTINFDGMQFSIKGDPTNGDKFTVSPSSNKSMFQTIGDFISALEKPSTGQPGGTRFANVLSSTLQNINNSLENVLTKQSAIGARLQEIDTLGSVGEDQEIQFENLLSNLQDVDYAKAISDLQRQQLYLQAAQQSYVKVSGLSLFNYI